VKVLDRYFAHLKGFVKEALDDKSHSPRQRLKRYLEIISGVLADAKWHRGCLIGNFSLGAFIKKSETEEKRPRTKGEIVDLLRSEGEGWAKWVGRLPATLLSEQVRMPGGISKSRFEMLPGTKEHEMHHRHSLR